MTRQPVQQIEKIALVMNCSDFQSTDPVREPMVCVHCGRFDAIQLSDRWLCPDCFAACGSCCAGEFDGVIPGKTAHFTAQSRVTRPEFSPASAPAQAQS